MLSFGRQPKDSDTLKESFPNAQPTTRGARPAVHRPAHRPGLRPTRNPRPPLHALRQDELPMQVRPTNPARALPALDPHRRRQDRHPQPDPRPGPRPAATKPGSTTPAGSATSWASSRPGPYAPSKTPRGDPVNAEISPSRSAERQIGGVIAVVSRDEVKFESLVEAALDAMLGVDSLGVILFVNRQTELLFGYDRDTLG